MSKGNPHLPLVAEIKKEHIKNGGILTSFKFIRKFFKTMAGGECQLIFSRVQLENLKIVNLC